MTADLAVLFLISDLPTVPAAAQPAALRLAMVNVPDDLLLSPKTQAWIAAFRYPEFGQQVWWPAGRHNSARD